MDNHINGKNEAMSSNKKPSDGNQQSGGNNAPIPPLTSVSGSIFVPNTVDFDVTVPTSRLGRLPIASAQHEAHYTQVRANMVDMFEREHTRLIFAARAEERQLAEAGLDRVPDRASIVTNQSDLDQMIANMEAPLRPGDSGFIDTAPDVPFPNNVGATPAEWLANETMRLTRAAYTDLQALDKVANERREAYNLALKREMEPTFPAQTSPLPKRTRTPFIERLKATSPPRKRIISGRRRQPDTNASDTATVNQKGQPSSEVSPSPPSASHFLAPSAKENQAVQRQTTPPGQIQAEATAQLSPFSPLRRKQDKPAAKSPHGLTYSGPAPLAEMSPEPNTVFQFGNVSRSLPPLFDFAADPPSRSPSASRRQVRSISPNFGGTRRHHSQPLPILTKNLQARVYKPKPGASPSDKTTSPPITAREDAALMIDKLPFLGAALSKAATESSTGGGKPKEKQLLQKAASSSSILSPKQPSATDYFLTKLEMRELFGGGSSAENTPPPASPVGSPARSGQQPEKATDNISVSVPPMRPTASSARQEEQQQQQPGSGPGSGMGRGAFAGASRSPTKKKARRKPSIMDKLRNQVPK